MPKNPYDHLLFDHIDGFEFFWVQNLSDSPRLQVGTTAEFSALIAPAFNAIEGVKPSILNNLLIMV